MMHRVVESNARTALTGSVSDELFILWITESFDKELPEDMGWSKRTENYVVCLLWIIKAQYQGLPEDMAGVRGSEP
jgi:hypothetical protein